MKLPKKHLTKGAHFQSILENLEQSSTGCSKHVGIDGTLIFLNLFNDLGSSTSYP